MIRFISLSSGSAGNCYFLGNEERGILIDAGVSLRYMKKAFLNVGLDYDSFNSVLVTHDHMDHIRNLGSYCKRIMKAVYATPTLLAARTMASDHVRACARPLEEGKWNEIDGFMVRFFVVPHDATQTVGYASPNAEVLKEMSEGDYADNEAYLPRSGWANDEMFHDNRTLQTKLAELWIKVKAEK